MCRGPRGQASLKGSSGPICGRAELPAMMSIPIHGFIGHVSVLLFPFPASLLAHKRSPFYLCDMEFSLVMVPCNRNRFFGTVRFPKEASSCAWRTWQFHVPVRYLVVHPVAAFGVNICTVH